MLTCPVAIRSRNPSTVMEWKRWQNGQVSEPYSTTFALAAGLPTRKPPSAVSVTRFSHGAGAAGLAGARRTTLRAAGAARISEGIARATTARAASIFMPPFMPPPPRPDNPASGAGRLRSRADHRMATLVASLDLAAKQHLDLAGEAHVGFPHFGIVDVEAE